MSQEKIIYAYNKALDNFFNELGSVDWRYSRRLNFSLTALSDGKAESSIAHSKDMFTPMVSEDLDKWKIGDPDLYQAEIDVINFEV
jgi:hypothetical protein